MNKVKKYKLNVVSLSVFKLSQIVSTLIITSVLLSYFDSKEYALIVVLTSIAQFVMIDTGAGESVKKHILQNSGDPRDIICNGLIITLALSIIVTCVMYGISQNMFVDDGLESHDILTVLLMSCMIMPLKISREAFSALHKTYIHSIFLTLSVIIATFYVYLVKVDSVIEAVIVQHGSILVGNLICTLYLFLTLKIPLTKLKVDRRYLSLLTPDAAKFFLIGISLMIINGFDILLLSHLGLEKELVTEISLILRICIYIHTFFMFAIYPSWPLLSSLKEQDYAKYQMVKLLLTGAIVVGGLASSLIVGFFIKDLIFIWTGIATSINSLVICGLLGFTYLRLLSDYFDYILRSEGKINIQLNATLIESIFHLVLGVIGWTFWGLTGFALTLPLSTLLCRLIPYLIQLTRIRAAVI